MKPYFVRDESVYLRKVKRKQSNHFSIHRKKNFIAKLTQYGLDADVKILVEQFHNVYLERDTRHMISHVQPQEFDFIIVECRPPSFWEL